MNLISAVIPCRDRSLLIRDALNSLIRQTTPDLDLDLEIIVVDDGSVDDSQAVVRAIAAGAPVRISLVSQDRLGLNVARNNGIKRARGEAVWLFDSDEIAPNGLLERLLTALDAFPEAHGVGGGYRTIHESRSLPRYVCRSCFATLKSFEVAAREAQETPQLVGGNALLRRSSFDLFGLFDERLSGSGDDTEWFTRATRSGGTFVFVPDAFIWHRVPKRETTPVVLLKRQTSFRNAQNFVRARVISGADVRTRADAAQALRFLLHAVRRRCLIGLARSLQWMMIALLPTRASGDARIPQ